MIPLIQPYVEAGMPFVALKAPVPDKAVTDIAPLGMQYDGDKPRDSARLTSSLLNSEM